MLLKYLENLLIGKLEQFIASGSTSHPDALGWLRLLLMLVGKAFVPRAEAFLEDHLAAFIEKAEGNPIQFELIELAVAAAVKGGGEVGTIVGAANNEALASLADVASVKNRLSGLASTVGMSLDGLSARVHALENQPPSEAAPSAVEAEAPADPAEAEAPDAQSPAVDPSTDPDTSAGTTDQPATNTGTDALGEQPNG